MIRMLWGRKKPMWPEKKKRKKSFLQTPVKIPCWQMEQNKHRVVNKVKTLLSLGPLQKFPSVLLTSAILLGTNTKVSLSFTVCQQQHTTNSMKTFKNIAATWRQRTHLLTNTNYGDEQLLKKLMFFKNAHNIHRQRRGEKSLKNTKINYTKDLLRHCLLNFWEDFAIFCFASGSPGKVCRSFQGKKQILFVAFLSTMKCRHLSLHLGVKSTVMTCQETGVHDDRLGSWWSKFVLSNRRGRKDWRPCSARTSALIVTIPIFTPLSECSHSRLQHCTSFYVVLSTSPQDSQNRHKNKQKEKNVTEL